MIQIGSQYTETCSYPRSQYCPGEKKSIVMALLLKYLSRTRVLVDYVKRGFLPRLQHSGPCQGVKSSLYAQSIVKQVLVLQDRIHDRT